MLLFLFLPLVSNASLIENDVRKQRDKDGHDEDSTNDANHFSCSNFVDTFKQLEVVTGVHFDSSVVLMWTTKFKSSKELKLVDVYKGPTILNLDLALMNEK